MKMRLNIGCGNNILDGYINIDIRPGCFPRRMFGNYHVNNSIFDGDSIRQLLFDFYDKHPCIYPLRKEHWDVENINLLYPGLGDAVIMTSLPTQAFLSSKQISITTENNIYLDDLLKDNQFLSAKSQGETIDNSVFPSNNWGGGHAIQLMEKALGFIPQIKPKGHIERRIKGEKLGIGICIETPNSGVQRSLTEVEIFIIQEFIIANPQYVFIEFGVGKPILNKTIRIFNQPIDRLMDELELCEYFIGMPNGLMNLAAALNIKSIILANQPNAEEFYLPCLTNGNGIKELAWMYPQNIHLHLDGENELVPKFSLENLNKALAGKIYPYWKEDYLPLVFEYDKITMKRLEDSFMIGDVEHLPFEKNSISEIQAIDVFEHISYLKSKLVLKHWVDLLKPNGMIQIQSPSITSILQYLMQAKTTMDVERVIALLFGGQDYEENFHKTICDPILLSQYLREVGITGDIRFHNTHMNLNVVAFK
jgi:hypothetical protein